MTVVDADVAALVRDAVAGPGRVVVLTGAGVSTASGIPTFRGPGGYWTVGSEVYTPEEIATRATFERAPEAVWDWYLQRLAACRAAEPNAAHRALVRLEEALGDRFTLITQNVDGLHRRAGSSAARTYLVHGDLASMRCSAECGAPIQPVPDDAAAHPEALRCERCGARMRPHVLWFDEVYDEERFRFDSSLAAARDAALLVTVGTSGATTLPVLVVETAVAAGAALVDVNPEPNPFGELAARLERGAALRAPAVEAVPALVDVIVEVLR
ncbi:MAG TPA: Sir2 family NAD-dependent protein deacetylase [Egibacteraceae bacterium]